MTTDSTQRRVFAAILLDVIVVVVFAAIGRASHDEGSPVVDALATAWPFLAGATVGWLLVRGINRTWPLSLRTGWPVWLSTIVVGMILRQVSGRGTAVPFIIVATVFLGIFLLGWRLVAGLVARRAHA
ncbi:DUF3054 domain-containing protein [Flexivirga sp. B27]